MERNIPKPGEKYIDFKKKPYQVVCMANHAETGEKMVVYQALYGEFACYARSLKIFLSEVDHEKYPEAEQKYYFELADEVKQNAPEDTSVKDLDINRHEMEILDLNEEQADPALLEFLDADTYEQKQNILISLRDRIDDKLIDSIAVTLDVVIPEGPVDVRYQQLLYSVRTMQKYESERLR